MRRGEIKLSSTALAHISEGVYRTAAGALKELVSNSFDSGATEVRITTDYPAFNLLQCWDNGQGMTAEDFTYLVHEGGIGESSKRSVKLKSPDSKLGRPIVGRLGIGMMGMAQLCRKFKVESHHRESKSAFLATIIFPDFWIKELEEKPRKRGVPPQGGQWELEETKYDPERVGFFISTTDLVPGLVKSLRKDVLVSDRDEVPRTLRQYLVRDGSNWRKGIPQRFEDFIWLFGSVKSVRELGEYYRLFFELAVLTPIEYMKGSPIPEKVLRNLELVSQRTSREKKIGKPKAYYQGTDHLSAVRSFVRDTTRQLSDFNFKVYLDGVLLRKPVSFAMEPKQRRPAYSASVYRVFSLKHDDTVDSEQLKFSGYIFTQQSVVKPTEIHGLLVRIRQVGIGGYSQTLLDYAKAVGPKNNWLTGEIYVEEGLEAALNVDRDSFHQTHAHYVALQDTVHRFLAKEVFPTLTAVSEVRRRFGRGAKDKERVFLQKARSLLRKTVQYSFDSTTDSPVFKESDDKWTVMFPKSRLWKSSSARGRMARAAVTAFFVAHQARQTARSRASIFLELIRHAAEP